MQIAMLPRMCRSATSKGKCFYQECPVLPPFLALYSVGSHSMKFSLLNVVRQVLEYLRVISRSKCREVFDFEHAVSPPLCTESYQSVYVRRPGVSDMKMYLFSWVELTVNGHYP